MAIPELGIALDTVCSIIVRAREFDAQEAVVEEDYGSNPIDEGFRSVLEAYPDDPTFQELQSAHRRAERGRAERAGRPRLGRPRRLRAGAMERSVGDGPQPPHRPDLALSSRDPCSCGLL